MPAALPGAAGDAQPARELILAAAALPPDYDEAGPAGRLTHVLLDQLAALPEADLSLPWPADPALAALCRELRDAPDDDRDMDALAKQAGMSGRTLARRFEASNRSALRGLATPPTPARRSGPAGSRRQRHRRRPGERLRLGVGFRGRLS